MSNPSSNDPDPYIRGKEVIQAKNRRSNSYSVRSSIPFDKFLRI